MINFKNLLAQNRLFDSHCHLNDVVFDIDREEVLTNAQSKGVDYVCDISVNLNSSERAVQNMGIDPRVLSTIGVDPEVCIPGSDLFAFEDDVDYGHELSVLMEKAKKSGKGLPIMLGETGVDNYWIVKNQVPVADAELLLDRQIKLFELHARMAEDFDIPLTIHSRNAIDICLGVLEKFPKVVAIFHSLTPDLEDTPMIFEKKLEIIFERGYFVGVNGIATFPSASILREALVKTLKQKDMPSSPEPIDFYNRQIVFETDAPWLAPAPLRGTRNQPANISLIYSFMKSLFS